MKQSGAARTVTRLRVDGRLRLVGQYALGSECRDDLG